MEREKHCLQLLHLTKRARGTEVLESLTQQSPGLAMAVPLSLTAAPIHPVLMPSFPSTAQPHLSFKGYGSRQPPSAVTPHSCSEVSLLQRHSPGNMLQTHRSLPLAPWESQTAAQPGAAARMHPRATPGSRTGSTLTGEG